MSYVLQDNRATRAAIGLFTVIALLIGWDLFWDFQEGLTWGNLLLEIAILLSAASGILLFWRKLQRAQAALTAARIETRAWREETRALLKGLGVVIQQQFSDWQLTRAESEVGLFLLKGLSHKEIAELRHTSERTIREQARALYRKSGLSGRSALSAFFLEDLLLPRSDEAPGHTAREKNLV
jgi:DNA-binding CsgD family transcriptional regulator